MKFTQTNLQPTGNRTIISYEVATDSGIVLENSSRTFDYCTSEGTDAIVEGLISEFETAKLAEWQAIDIQAYLSEKQAKEQTEAERQAYIKSFECLSLNFRYKVTVPVSLRDNPQLHNELEVVIFKMGEEENNPVKPIRSGFTTTHLTSYWMNIEPAAMDIMKQYPQTFVIEYNPLYYNEDGTLIESSPNIF